MGRITPHGGRGDPPDHEAFLHTLEGVVAELGLYISHTTVLGLNDGRSDVFALKRLRFAADPHRGEVLLSGLVPGLMLLRRLAGRA